MTKILLTANIIALVAFVIMAFALPLHGELQARERFTELDRSGAISAPAIEKLDAEHRFGNAASLDYRDKVPTWIAAPSTNGLRLACNIGIALTLMNVALMSASILKPAGGGKKKR